jgi:hypothetical protein
VLQHIVRNKYYNLHISSITIRPVNAEIYANPISIFTPLQLFIIRQDDNQIHSKACSSHCTSNILFAKDDPQIWHPLYISITKIHCALVAIWASESYPLESTEKIISVIWYDIIDHNFRHTCSTTLFQSPFYRSTLKYMILLYLNDSHMAFKVPIRPHKVDTSKIMMKKHPQQEPC